MWSQHSISSLGAVRWQASPLAYAATLSDRFRAVRRPKMVPAQSSPRLVQTQSATALSCQHIGRAWRSPAAAISCRKAFASSIVLNPNRGFSSVGLVIGQLYLRPIAEVRGEADQIPVRVLH
jgi:hypothetical protein